MRGVAVVEDPLIGGFESDCDTPAMKPAKEQDYQSWKEDSHAQVSDFKAVALKAVLYLLNRIRILKTVDFGEVEHRSISRKFSASG